MPDIDIPHLARQENMSMPRLPEGFKPPPQYTSHSGPSPTSASAAGGGDGSNVHNHFYQMQVDEPRAKPWYRTKKCFVIGLVLALFFVVAAIAVGIALAVVLTRRHRDEGVGQLVMTAATMVTSATASTSSTSTTPLVSLVTETRTVEVKITSESTTIPSTATVVRTLTPEVSRVTETLVKTFTAEPPVLPAPVESEDLGQMLSSLLIPVTRVTTRLITVTPVPTSESTSSTSTSTTSTFHITSSTLSTSSPSSSTPTPTTTALEGISSLSSIAVINLSSAGRRADFWQSGDHDLIVRVLRGDDIEMYSITNKTRGEGVAEPKHGTPLAAAADDEGSLHLFYLDEDDNTIQQLTLNEDDDWSGTQVLHKRDILKAASGSHLSATWHQSNMSNGKITKSLALLWQTDDNEIMILMNEKPSDPEAWIMHDMGMKVDVIFDDTRDNRGLAIASGNLPGQSRDGFSGLFVAVESNEAIFMWNCSIGYPDFLTALDQCHWLNDTWHDKARDITVQSHPVTLSWDTSLSSSRDTPVIHGLVVLENRGVRLSNNYLDAIDGATPVWYTITKNLDSFTTAEGGVFLALEQRQLWEYMILDEEQTARYVGEIDTGALGGMVRNGSHPMVGRRDVDDEMVEE